MTIEIGKDGLCRCDCGTSCPLGKVGMETRCSDKDLKRKLWSLDMIHRPGITLYFNPELRKVVDISAFESKPEDWVDAHLAGRTPYIPFTPIRLSVDFKPSAMIVGETK